jgi:hypothetical protein
MSRPGVSGNMENVVAIIPGKATILLHFTNTVLKAVILLGTLGAGAALAAPVTITPGTVWQDTEGHVIQAHGGGIIQVGKTYYWFGEDHSGGWLYKDIPCYSSNDLSHWTFKGYALTHQPSGDLGPNRIVERPKVLYNKHTKTFVMYLHIDDTHYSEAKVGVATSKRVTGPYTYIGSFSPMGRQSRDMSVFQDTDDTQYLVFEDRGEGGGVQIEQLAPDGLTVQKEVAVVGSRGGHEAPAIVKVNGTYFLLGSHLTGWSTNDNEYATAPALSGPWSGFQDVAPKGTHTYDSQTAWILTVHGTKTTSYIYMGDRWKSNDLGDSRYIWLPLTIQGQTMSLAPNVPWTIDTKTGEVGTP